MTSDFRGSGIHYWYLWQRSLHDLRVQRKQHQWSYQEGTFDITRPPSFIQLIYVVIR